MDHRAVELRPWWSLANNDPPKAFLIHSCCWSLLVRHFANDEVNLDRLFEVCRRRPVSRTSDYIREHSVLTWKSLPHPLLRPVIRGIGDATKKFSKIQRWNKIPSSNTILGADCFGLFPIEIRLEIAAYLSTADFLVLRLASRAMAPVFSLQSFWRTRFRINGDRGYLIRLSDEPHKRNNWRTMSRCTTRIEKPYLRHWELRRRWINNGWLIDRYSMTQAPSGQNEVENNMLSGVAWREVKAEIACDRITRGMLRPRTKCTCHPVTMSQTVLLHDRVVCLNVFILNEGTMRNKNGSHIIGFDLISVDAKTPNITIGHRLPGSQVTIDFYGRRLRGFTITTGNCGIRALRPVWNDRTVTSWIGDWEHGDTSTELVLKDDVKAISAKFDASHFRPTCAHICKG
jgi:hypothetical protein